jgi:hypothetical protein
MSKTLAFSRKSLRDEDVVSSNEEKGIFTFNPTVTTPYSLTKQFALTKANILHVQITKKRGRTSNASNA